MPDNKQRKQKEEEMSRRTRAQNTAGTRTNKQGMADVAFSKQRQKHENARYASIINAIRQTAKLAGVLVELPRVSKRKHRGEHNPTKPSIYFKQARRFQLKTGNFKAKYQKANHIG